LQKKTYKMKIFLSITFLLCSFALISQPQVKTETPSGPRIKFLSETFDYGEIIAQSSHDGLAEFIFVNIGNEPLVLTNVRAGCGCTSPFWHKEPVLPGDSAKVVLKYTTINHPHNISRTAMVQSNAVNQETVVIRITGKVIAKPDEVMPEKNTSEFSPHSR